jgi:hypothetical protein
MKNPVTISTGVTYEQKNIEKWFFTYKKNTCPATMQTIHSYDTTPNLTLKSLIQTWLNKDNYAPISPPPSPLKHQELVSLLNTIETTPFKVTLLKKLKSVIEVSDQTRGDFVKSGGVEALVKIIVQVVSSESSDFAAFTACEEALGILYKLALSDDEAILAVGSVTSHECVKSMAIMLQRGSKEARVYALSMFEKLAKQNFCWSIIVQEQGMDLFKSILELVSDEISTKTGSCALKVFIEILNSSKKTRLKAIQAGAICTLIELLPETNRSKCEKILHIIKLLCECADGRVAFIEHGLGIAAVSEKMLQVSEVASKIVVKILWLICSFHPNDRVSEEMMVFGGVKKLVTLLHFGGRSSTKEKVVKIFKLFGKSWKKYPCFPCDLKDYLGLIDD